MKQNHARPARITGWVSACLATLVLSLSAPACLAGAATDVAAPLLERYARLKPQLAQNHLNYPVHISSAVNDGHGIGDIHARLSLPYARLREYFSAPQNWCKALILHIYIKSCNYLSKDQRPRLQVYLGDRHYAEPEEVFRFDYQLRIVELGAEYILIDLFAEDGPMDSANYHIRIAVIPLDEQHSFMHFYYEADYGFFSRAAMSTYLATLGRNKLGFSLATGDQSDGPRFIKGMRGVIERNAMRYLLAIIAYLVVLDAPKKDWLEPALEHWHAYTELFRPQLYDLSKSELLELKQQEYRNQLRLQREGEKTEPDE